MALCSDLFSWQVALCIAGIENRAQARPNTLAKPTNAMLLSFYRAVRSFRRNEVHD
jgi:hypothetical protein